MSAEGIARATRIQTSHVPQYVRPLIREGHVHPRMAHVQGRPRRRRVYDLTDSGRATAIRLRKRIETEPVRVRDEAGVRESTMAQVLAEASVKVPLLHIVLLAAEGGPIDLGRLKGGGPPHFVELLTSSPRLGSFVGRKRQLETITSEEERPRIFVVRGVAGMGKSWFGAKAGELLRGKRNLFWRSIRSWDTLQSVLTSLGTFLSALGKPGLQAVLTRGEASRAPDVLRDDLSGTNSFLIFDDAHEASAEVVSFFRMLKDIFSDVRDVHALVLTRRTLPFYNRRDVAATGLVQEMELPGLSIEDLKTLLSAEGANQGILRASRKLGGLPLALELVRAVGPEGRSPPSLTNVHRFLEEEILRVLSSPERTMLKLASLYRVPVPKEALYAHATLTYDVLMDLEDRSLLRASGDGRYEAHDTIRGFFSSIITKSERSRLGAFAAKRLRELASNAHELGDLVSCVDFISNALDLPAPKEDHLILWELLGDVKKELGDLPNCLGAFREAMRRTTDQETIARLHRKTAWALRYGGDFVRARSEVKDGLRALGDHASGEAGWLYLLKSLFDEDRSWQQAREDAGLALQVFREFRVPQGEGEALLQLGSIELHSPKGNRTLAQQDHEAALDLSGQLSDPVFATKVDRALAHMYAWHLADVERALTHLEKAKARVGARREHESLGLLYDEAEINLELLADHATAERQFTEVESRGRRIYQRAAGPLSRFYLTLSSYFQGRFSEAQKGFEGLVEAMGALGPFWQLRTMWLLAECCLLQGDFKGFARIAAAFSDPDIVKEAEGEGGAALPVPAAVLRGLNRLLNGEIEGSRAALADAVRLAEQASEIDEAPALSWSYLGPFYYGIALRVIGKNREATNRVRQAVETLRKYGMKARLSIIHEQERQLTRVLRAAHEVAHTKPT